MDKKRFCWDTRPQAETENIVVCNKVRITVLTARLLRLEYSSVGIFEDRASQSAFYRDFASAAFQLSQEGDMLTLETENLLLHCRTNGPFAPDTLSVSLKQEPAACWHYGDVSETLGGTTQTLDSVNDSIPLEDGLCSRRGAMLYLMIRLPCY